MYCTTAQKSSSLKFIHSGSILAGADREPKAEAKQNMQSHFLGCGEMHLTQPGAKCAVLNCTVQRAVNGDA